ncbi:MAG: hypothetical protein CH6_0953 [Candidatus Kapaibacterium sp.]|nr:MAG: hypothetical protein CH6_0953 [Candidatus Kapabacteria bacterium]
MVVICLVFLLAIFSSKAQDDICPGAVAERETYLLVDCPPFHNCILRIYYCCFFDETNQELTVRIKQIHFLGQTDDRSSRAAWNCYLACYRYNEEKFWDDVASGIVKDLKRYDNPCLPFVPECGGGGNAFIIVKITRSTCWYFENFWFTKYEDQWLLGMKPCGVEKCFWEYKICKRGGDVEILEKLKYATAPPECNWEEPTELPPPGKTWEEYWRTDCFPKPCVF